LAPLVGCSDDGADGSEWSEAAVEGEFGSHVAVYERWYAGPTRGDLADDAELVAIALERAGRVIGGEAGRKYNNGQVVGEPRAVFAVDTASGSVVYAIGHISYDIDAESYTASGVPLPFAVVVMMDDRGRVRGIRTETPVSQGESGTVPPEGPFALGAYADPAGEQLLVLDTGVQPAVMVGIRRGDPETGPIAVETWRQPDVSTRGYALLGTGGTMPHTAQVRALEDRYSGEVTGTVEEGLYFSGLMACCTSRAVTGNEAPLTNREARALVRSAAGDRISAGQYEASQLTKGVYQARLSEGGIAVVQNVNAYQVIAARLADGHLVAGRCVNPDEVRSFVCHVPTTDAWFVGADCRHLEVRTARGEWRRGAYLDLTSMALVEGSSPQMRVKVNGEWTTMDLEQAHDPAGPSAFEAYGRQCAAADMP
jgi:hypothetical protein